MLGSSIHTGIKKLDNEAGFLVARPHFYAKNAL